MHIKLEERRRAIANWRRLKVLLTILKLCGNRFEIEDATPTIIIEKDEIKQSWDERMAKFIYLPTDRTKIGWDLFVSLVYFSSIFGDLFFTVMGLFPLVVPFLKTM